MLSIIDFILHIDKYLNIIIQKFGIFTYILVFIIIFLETGLVVTPFLPGDSLLFAAGAFAALGYLNIFILFLLLVIAAILGDTANYLIGNAIGKRAFQRDDAKFFRQEYLIMTQKFYEDHGAKAIVLARFIPIIRTFVPFVAGIGKMKYPRFLAYNIIGGVAWVIIFLFAGYIFGNIPIVKENFTLFIGIIIIVSVLIGLIEAAKFRRQQRKALQKDLK